MKTDQQRIYSDAICDFLLSCPETKVRIINQRLKKSCGMPETSLQLCVDGRRNKDRNRRLIPVKYVPAIKKELELVSDKFLKIISKLEPKKQEENV